YAEPKIISYVSKNCFWPAPKVDSAIIKITPSKLRGPTPQFASLFFKIVRAGFSQPRKQLAGNLLALSRAEGSKSLKLSKKEVEEWLKKNGVNPTQRAETLSIEDWKNLSNNFPV
ncbi:MAG: rRNA adenine N-6-methyltransferase family protein, partial [Patescibacteria group bacterium]